MNNELADRLSALGSHLEHERRAVRSLTAPERVTIATEAEGAAVIDFAERGASTTASSSPWLLRAAAVIALVGLGVGLVVARTGGDSVPGVSDEGVTLPAVAEPADVVSMIPAQLPGLVSLGQRNGEALLVRTQPSSLQERLYSNAVDPSDPSGMVSVSYSNHRDGNRPVCTSIGPDGEIGPSASATAFEVDNGTAQWCGTTGKLVAGWLVDGLEISAFAGSGIDAAELTDLVRSFDTVAATPADDRRPVADLVPALPPGWVALVDSDVPFDQQIVESSWVATTGGADDGEQQLVVQAWSGVDDQGIYAITPPFFAERVTVRGHAGYLYRSAVLDGDTKPAQVEVWWTEQPGTVVSVESNNLYDTDELLAFVEALETADTAQLESFLNDPANR